MEEQEEFFKRRPRDYMVRDYEIIDDSDVEVDDESI